MNGQAGKGDRPRPVNQTIYSKNYQQAFPMKDTDPRYWMLPTPDNVNILNLILRMDSYKLFHKPQYPKGTEQVFAYGEARIPNGRTIFFGLQPHLDAIFNVRVTHEDLRQARAFSKAHTGRDLVTVDDWIRVINHYKGRIPLDIYSAPEGELIPGSNALFVVFNRDKQLFWMTNAMEDILSWVWYPTTIASNSFECKQDIRRWLAKTGGDVAAADFMLHDFGLRGVTCLEQAMIGGLAHLTSFKGTDTMPAILFGIKHYNSGMCGFSIPASEHSTITSWGNTDEDEIKAYENMLDTYPDGLFACVSDGRNVYNAVRDMWGGKLRDRILQREGKLVIRPDSGDPVEVNRKLLQIIWEKFGGTVNAKGFRVFDSHVGLIQGDGIDRKVMNDILQMAYDEKFAASNYAFGSGGGLLQKFNRDTNRFAIKCGAIVVNGEKRNVSKNPITDPGKNSKSGYVYLARDEDTGEYKTLTHFDPLVLTKLRDSAFIERVIDGEIVNRPVFADIVDRVSKYADPIEQ